MIYHYTKSSSLPSILDQGLRAVCLGPPLTAGEKPVVWFSTNPLWARTVFALFAPTFEQAYAAALDEGILLARIGCEELPTPSMWIPSWRFR